MEPGVRVYSLGRTKSKINTQYEHSGLPLELDVDIFRGFPLVTTGSDNSTLLQPVSPLHR